MTIKTEKPARVRGRPPSYTAELAERVLDGLSAGRTLGEVCREDGMPAEMTVRKWVLEDTNGFAERYRRARRTGLTAAPGQVRYSPEIADAIIDALASGQPLCEICKDVFMPGNSTIARWVAEDRDGFRARYRLARQTGHGRSGQIAYSPQRAEDILGELRRGRTLNDICRDPDMPHVVSVHNWRTEDRDGFASRYDTARRIGAEIMKDDAVDIAMDRDSAWILRHNNDGTTEAFLDPERVSQARLRMEAKKWRASQLQPRVYADLGALNGTRQDGSRDSSRSWADLLQAVDGQSRGLPNKARDRQ